jgi:protein-disulfide isomerase
MTEKTNSSLNLSSSGFFITPLTAVLIVLAFGLGIGLGYLIWGRADSKVTIVEVTPTADVYGQAQPTQGKVTRYPVPVDDDYALGPADAPITIIEFSDFQCPYCKKWYSEVLGPLMQNFPGKIRFVYRDFPLYSIHPEAGPAALAANCAGEQGKYYEYHDKLFSNDYSLGSEAYVAYATALDLDVEKFKTCISEKRYEAEVQADYQYAANLGIQSTPTFFINGIALVGAQPYSVFEEVITKELAGEIP